jgi:ribosome-binding factor A
VFISVIGDADTAEKKLRWLRTRAVDIRQELARRIVLKFLPKFEYVLDQSVIRGERTRKLIDELGPMMPSEPELKPDSEKAP